MNTFVATIDLSLGSKLKEDLANQGFEFSTPPYTVFAAQKKGISCTLYTSGKLTVQGKDKDDFIAYYLEPEILQTLDYTYPEVNVDMTARIGSDEAGKGDFFGPLCIGAAQADEAAIKKLLEIGVKDSKRMADKTVLEMAKKIKNTVPHAIVRLSPKKYNELYASFHNLNRLLAWGHAAAIGELVEKTGCKEVLIDQFSSEPLVENALRKKNIETHLTQRPRAEEDPVVAAASILARAAFLDGIEQLSQQHGITLPKGASGKVVETAKALVKQKGKEILGEVAKLHFKTTDEVLHNTLF
jgi:ribonuclease HIII